jgi:type IV pilus assembly protein PilY1
MIKPTFHFRSLSATLLVLLFAGHPVLADDTEVLIGPGGQAWAKPNVLFIMDTSGSMRNSIAGTTATTADPSRLSIVQGVFADLMNNVSYHGMNVGLMRFDSGGNGGYFVTPMQELNSSTKDSFITASNAFTPGGDTPLSETLYEAARFYGGLSVDYGDSSHPGTNDPGVFSGSTYTSPISSQCQANYVVLLTDGDPNTDNDADSKISTDFLGGSSCGGSGDGHCLDDVAGYLHTHDQSNISGTQTVETYTIGFTTSQTLLQDTATAGGGEYVMANSADELASAFAGFLGTISETNDTFSPPALAANSFNGISHFNKLYFALFEPAATPKWNGNVKPYSLNDSFQLVDAAGANATDDRGFFLSSSRSFWSDTAADGGSIAAGGANGRLPNASARKLFTYTGGYDLTSGLVPDSPALSTPGNALKTVASSDLTPAMLGITGVDPALTTEFNNVIDTIRSSNLGAPLHSQPALVTYGGTEAAPDLTLFVATNDGFLHALNASPGDEGGPAGGRELFAFIPKELLTNLPTLASGTGSHPYGLDGDITVWVNDDNGDHTISGADDHVYVYVGMRRGGNNYYALDVTNRSAPTLKWVIRCGPGGTPGFEELGQSWSKPILTTIQYATDTGTGTRKVLIFGGGYDTAQDANPLDTNDSIGRAIYVVDANTGERLWWAGPTGSGANFVLDSLTNSIPSEVRLLDSDLDGSTDRLYVGDMRGQVFRFDLQATATAMSGSGIRLANLGGTIEANNRRFFYPPDVVVTHRPGSPTYISLNIGSGYRAHPLNPLNHDGTAAPRVNDRFYSLRDPYVVGPIPSGATVTTITDGAAGNLLDVTSSLVTSDGDISALAASTGWYITLGAGNGEKVLAPSVTLNGEIFFTTYTPPASVARTDCAPPPGSGRLYRVSLFDANPVSHETGGVSDPDAPAPTVGDRVADTLSRPGIPSGTKVMFRENGAGGVEVIHCEGTECGDLPNAIKMQETYWTDGS